MYRRCVDLCAGSHLTRRLVLAVQDLAVQCSAVQHLAVQDSGDLDLAQGSADLARQVSRLVPKLVGSTDLVTEIVG